MRRAEAQTCTLAHAHMRRQRFTRFEEDRQTDTRQEMRSEDLLTDCVRVRIVAVYIALDATASKGNLTENALCLFMSCGLALPVVFMHAYFIILQTYVYVTSPREHRIGIPDMNNNRGSSPCTCVLVSMSLCVVCIRERRERRCCILVQTGRDQMQTSQSLA